jgi:hypothetical protein
VAVERREPARGLEAERDRHRLLAEGAPGHDRPAVRLGEVAETGDEAVEAPTHRAERRAQLQHQRRVEHVLGGRAKVHVGRELGADRHPQRLDQRHHRGARGRRRGTEVRHVEPLRRRAVADAQCRLGRDHAELRLGPRQRRLDVEHRLQALPVREARRHFRVGE